MGLGESENTREGGGTGMEGFAGNSTPLYLYSNPGAWSSLMGNDFVRNHKVEGIDYATMHVYVDQWLCVEQGSTQDGQLSFLKCAALPHRPPSLLSPLVPFSPPLRGLSCVTPCKIHLHRGALRSPN